LLVSLRDKKRMARIAKPKERVVKNRSGGGTLEYDSDSQSPAEVLLSPSAGITFARKFSRS